MSVEDQTVSSEPATDRPIDDGDRSFTTELTYIITAWMTIALLAGLGLIVFGETLASLIV